MVVNTGKLDDAVFVDCKIALGYYKHLNEFIDKTCDIIVEYRTIIAK